MTRYLLLSLLFIAALSACSDSGSDSGSARVRFIHAAPDSGNADIFIDSIREVRNLEYGKASTYNEIEDGDRRLRVFLDEVVPAVDHTSTFDEETDYSAFFTSELAGHELMLVPDDNTPPAGDEFRVRFGNFSYDFQSIDIYIVRPGQLITDVNPVAAGLRSRNFSPYIDAPVGRYRVVFTAAGSTAALAITEPLTIASGTTWTVVALDPAGGGGTSLSPLILLDNLNHD